MENNILDNLLWYRLQVELVNTRLIPAATAHPVSVMEAIIKGTNISINYTQPVIFHIKGKNHKFRFQKNEKVLLEILFFLCSEEDVLIWKKAFIEYLSNPETGKNFEISSISAPQQRNLSRLYSEIGDIPSSGEICLEFMTPLHFKTENDKPRTYISKEAFIDCITKRIKRLFNSEVNHHLNSPFHILPYYWNYTEIKHPSRSQAGHIQYINGCVGKLYIKGNLSEIMPFIVLCSEIHAGSKLSNSYGYYILHKNSPPYLDKRILNKGAILSVIHDVMERYDLSEMIDKECKPTETTNLDAIFNEESFAEELIRELITDTYKPEPNIAFQIKKKNGGSRTIEQLNFKDLVVASLILKFISEPFDRILESSSIGFRKGISRLKAIEIFNEAVNEGYHYVIESDIEDFFPSVNLEILQLLIDHYIPSRDLITKSTIKKILLNGYKENGIYHPRTKGLAQGNPLSPIFANLYLDTFDEQIASMNLKLIRYADDFIILAKSKQEAEEALLKTESFLAEVGLKLKKEKTSIKSVFDGFEFLGIRFEQGDISSISGEDIKTFKKPLYITEPYVFIALNGETINIKKDGKTIESLPIRRLSEIIAMGNVAFSSALIKKCTEWNIPLTFTLGSGYYITTIKPETKNHFDIAYQHANKYYHLSEAMRLEIAKEIVRAKIENYSTLFRIKKIGSEEPIFKILEKAIDSVNLSTSIVELRGIEGITSKRVYETLNRLIDNPAFHIHRRRRENPDRINTLLNLAHYIIFSRINATLRAVGLNPYLGFLHEPDSRYESLAADLQEPFRPQTEGIIIKLLNMKIIKEEDFTESDKGLYLKKEALKTFLNHFETELDKKTIKNIPSLKDQIYLQIIIVKQYMVNNQHLTFYRWKG